MRELVRAVASHCVGYVRWVFEPNNGAAPAMAAVYDAVDDWLLNRPGYRITIIVEREDGVAAQHAPKPRLLAEQEAV